ncbi:hypothetical protein Q1695_013643 [Nippostrongylus brasiliensis]|nr:hypothetical protein Q1695_013643 [Nippostrongylus brasiliensis]
MWNCPNFVEEPLIEATRVVHPLSRLVTEPFVQNSVSSGGDSSRIKVFTGPNACGKSVYLKQVGLLVFLAHIGSFVPAEVAHIGIINKIFSRMYSVDSVLDGMSTFAKDLNQVSSALRRGDQRSLIIIDEFGKGTLTILPMLVQILLSTCSTLSTRLALYRSLQEVGLPLLASTLSYWTSKGNDYCPHVFVSSHFHALKAFIKDECEAVSYHTMEVRCRGKKLDFLYRLVDGLVESSYAAYTAEEMGVPVDVVNRALQASD